ncbi:MAG: hypothetical protein LAP40_13765 [Acidobacteriia bacterium]|nr:hypothetical protein [Terriglobia bacterium]
MRATLSHTGATLLAAIASLTWMCVPALGQTDSLALSSSSAAPGGTVTLNLSLNAPTGQQPSGIQWTFGYSAADVVALSAAAGPSASAAGKTLSCSSSPGSSLCILSGLNNQAVPNGVVAVVTVTLSASFAGTSIAVAGTMGALPTGSGQAVTGTGGAVTLATGSSTGSAVFLRTDATTQGSWKPIYGSEGYSVIGDSTSLPSYVTLASGASSFVWAASTADVRALQKAASSTDRIAAAWYSNSTLDVHFNFSDQSAHAVAIYLVDWDLAGRSAVAEVMDANGNVLDTRTVANFGGGQYLVWDLAGNVTLRLSALHSNAVLSGIFFGPVRLPVPSCAGVYRGGAWYVDWNCNGLWDLTDAAHVFSFGQAGDVPVLGDWNGDGRLKIGVFRAGTWYVDWNGNNQWDSTDAAHVMSFGQAGDVPVLADWNGDGRLKIGVFRSGAWYVDWNGNNQWDATDASHVMSFGQAGDVPVLGDWNGDGRRKIGVFRSGLWYVDWNGTGNWDLLDLPHAFVYGQPGDAPVMSNWSAVP